MKKYRKGDIQGSLGGAPDPPPPYNPIEEPNSLQSRSIFRVIDLLCEGEIEGLVKDGANNTDGHQSIFLNGTPLQKSGSATYNFNGVNVQERTGTPNQTAVDSEFTTYPPTTPVAVGVDVTIAGGPVVRNFTDPAADSVLLVFAYAGMYEQKDNGDLVGSKVQLTYQIQAVDTLDTTGVVDVIVEGKCMSVYQENHRVTLPNSVTGEYDITITRITADSVTSKLLNPCSFHSYSIIKNRKLTYPDTAYIAGTVDAELFGDQIPTRSYLIRGLKIATPKGYTPPYKDGAGDWQPADYPGDVGNPVTSWDGTLDADATYGTGGVQYCANPAWCFYDLIVTGRYGAGIDGNAMDIEVLKPLLYTIGKYCDELIDDGFGSTEPRFTLNCVINNQHEAYNLINQLAAAFRGMCWWGPGTVLVSQDAPTNSDGTSDPQVLAHPGNVIDGVFVYEGSGLKARHTAALVTYNDPDNHYKPVVELYEDVEGIAELGYRPLEIAPFGCASRGQAHRAGKWLVDSEKTETEMVKYVAGLDHAFVTPGMIVAVSDPYYATASVAHTEERDESAMKRMAGRIVSVAGTTVVLDKEVTLETGQTYILSCMTTEIVDVDTDQNIIADFNGQTTVEDVTVNGAATGWDVATDTIILNSTFTNEPQANAVFILVASNLEPRLFRVLSNTEIEGKYEIVGLLHDDNKYGRVENNIYFEPTPWSDQETQGIILPPSNNNLELRNAQIDGKLQNLLVFSWNASSDARVKRYEIQWKRSETSTTGIGNWENFPQTTNLMVEMSGVSDGYYEFRVRSIIDTGASSAWMTSTLTISANILPAVTNLTLVNQGQTATEFVGGDIEIVWDKVANITTDHPDNTAEDSNFDTYVVEIDSTFTYETRDNAFNYTYERNFADNSSVAQRSVQIDVYQRSTAGVLSAPVTLNVSNPAPDMSAVFPTLTAGFKSLKIDWSSVQLSDADLDHFDIWLASYNASTDPTALDKVATVGKDTYSWVETPLETGTNYEVRILPYDRFGAGVPSAVVAEAPSPLGGVDVNIELSESIAISTSEGKSQAEHARLYDRDLDTLSVSFQALNNNEYIEYDFGLQTYVDQVMLYVGDNNPDPSIGQVYFAYDANGDGNWVFLKAEADHTLDANGTLLDAVGVDDAAKEADAQTNFWELTYDATKKGLNLALFPQRVIASKCRVYFTGTGYTSIVFELIFVRQVIAESVVADRLSAISADIGDVSGGTYRSTNYTPGVKGFLLDGAEDATSYFNNIQLVMNWNTGFGAGSSGVPDAGATVGAVWNGNVSGQPNDADITNANVSINADGSLQGGGGGQVTLNGIGYVGDTDAQKNYVLPSDENLISYYSMDGVLTDVISGNNLAESGTITFANSIAGKCAVFDGTNGFDLPDNFSAVTAGGTYSISLWIKMPDTSISGTVINFAPGLTASDQIGIVVVGSRVIACEYTGSSYNGHRNDSNLVNDAWYHVAMTNAGADLKLYVNGIEYTTVDGRDLSAINAIGYNAVYNFAGSIDEVRIFDVVITQDEVRALYENPGGPASLSGDFTEQIIPTLSYTNFPPETQNINTTKFDVGLPNVQDGADPTQSTMEAGVLLVGGGLEIHPASFEFDKKYVQLLDGTIAIKYRVGVAGDWTNDAKDEVFQAVVRTEFGEVTNGAWEGINGLFVNQPDILLMPKMIKSYVQGATVDLVFNFDVDQIYEHDPAWNGTGTPTRQDGSMRWAFLPISRLVGDNNSISGGTNHYDNEQATDTDQSTPQHPSQTNVIGLDVSVRASSELTDGYTGWYRQCSAYIQYRTWGSGTWSNATSTTFNVSDALGASVPLPSASFSSREVEWRVYFTFSNRGGTYTVSSTSNATRNGSVTQTALSAPNGFNAVTLGGTTYSSGIGYDEFYHSTNQIRVRVQAPSAIQTYLNDGYTMDTNGCDISISGTSSKGIFYAHSSGVILDVAGRRAIDSPSVGQISSFSITGGNIDIFNTANDCQFTGAAGTSALILNGIGTTTWNITYRMTKIVAGVPVDKNRSVVVSATLDLNAINVVDPTGVATYIATGG